MIYRWSHACRSDPRVTKKPQVMGSKPSRRAYRGWVNGITEGKPIDGAVLSTFTYHVMRDDEVQEHFLGVNVDGGDPVHVSWGQFSDLRDAEAKRVEDEFAAFVAQSPPPRRKQDKYRGWVGGYTEGKPILGCIINVHVFLEGKIYYLSVHTHGHPPVVVRWSKLEQACNAEAARVQGHYDAWARARGADKEENEAPKGTDEGAPPQIEGSTS